MLQIKQVCAEILSSNMYILFEEGHSDCWIIDIGDYNALSKELPINANIKGIFLTHGHFDHIADINRVHNIFPDCIIYTSEYGKEQLLSAKKNFSYYHKSSTEYCGKLELIDILKDGDEISLNNTTLKVLATPGHCPSCLTYYTDKYIFTGDSLIPGVDVVTKLPKGNKSLANISIEKINNLAKNRLICPGHDLTKEYHLIL